VTVEIGPREECQTRHAAPSEPVARSTSCVAGVVVTHEAQLASWADRVVFLRDGHVVDQTVAPPGPESLLATADR